MTEENAVTERIASTHSARRIAWLAVLILLMLSGTGVWAAVGDQVERKATHREGVSLYGL
jgi:hypothetical protein